MKGIVFTVATIALMVIGFLFSKETQIEYAIYFGIGMGIVFGSAGIAWLSKRMESIIGGMIIAAFWPAIWDAFQTAISTMP